MSDAPEHPLHGKRIESKTFGAHISFDGCPDVLLKIRVFIDQDKKRVVGVRSINLYDIELEQPLRRFDTGSSWFEDVEIAAIPPGKPPR